MQKILIVDDDEIQLHLQSGMLVEEGYTVHATADGPQGITLFKAHKPDLVLLDLGLPSMGGMEVMRELKKIDPRVKVMVFTGSPSVESTVAALRAGACDYVKKPFEQQLLLKKIENALSTVGD